MDIKQGIYKMILHPNKAPVGASITEELLDIWSKIIIESLKSKCQTDTPAMATTLKTTLKIQQKRQNYKTHSLARSQICFYNSISSCLTIVKRRLLLNQNSVDS